MNAILAAQIGATLAGCRDASTPRPDRDAEIAKRLSALVRADGTPPGLH